MDKEYTCFGFKKVLLGATEMTRQCLRKYNSFQMSNTGSIPSKFVDLFKRINHEVVWMHFVWSIFRQLYGSEESVAVLNTSGGAAALVIQESLLDDVMLSLARLLDPPSSGKNKDNLVIEALRPLVVLLNDVKQVDAFDNALRNMRDSSRKIFEHRNKRIAHSDMGVSLAMSKLPGVSRNEIQEVLHHCHEVMNVITLNFGIGETIYKEVTAHGDGSSLIAILQDGLRLRQIRRESYEEMTNDELRKAVQLRPPYPSD